MTATSAAVCAAWTGPVALSHFECKFVTFLRGGVLPRGGSRVPAVVEC